jgi:hypothetical protein
LFTSEKTSQGAAGSKKKKRRMRQIDYLKSAGMLLLTTQFVNDFHQAAPAQQRPA